MTEERTSETTQPISDGAPELVGGDARTVEQVEAEYRARQAGKDRENEALRQELARFKATEAQRTTEAEQRRTAELGEVEALKRQLAEERQARTSEVRSVRFPNAADVLDPSALAAMDEAKLAALEERLAPKRVQGTAGAVIDPNSPPRNPPQGTPQEKSVEDLKADLAKYAPDFVQELQQR